MKRNIISHDLLVNTIPDVSILTFSDDVTEVVEVTVGITTTTNDT